MRTELLLADATTREGGSSTSLYRYDLRLCSKYNTLFNLNYFKLFFQSFFYYK